MHGRRGSGRAHRDDEHAHPDTRRRRRPRCPRRSEHLPRPRRSSRRRPPQDAALEASRAVFVTAPVVVVAPADDVAAQLTAASAAVALGAPVLLTGPATDPAPLLAELVRLDAEAVLAVGAVTLTPPSAVTVVPVPAGAGADALRAATGARFGAPTEVPAGQEAGSRPRAHRAAAGRARRRPARIARPRRRALRPRRRRPSPTPSTAAPSLPRTRPPAAVAGTVALTGVGVDPLAALATLRAAGVPVLDAPGGDPRATTPGVQAIAAAAPEHTIALGAAFGPPDQLAPPGGRRVDRGAPGRRRAAGVPAGPGRAGQEVRRPLRHAGLGGARRAGGAGRARDAGSRRRDRGAVPDAHHGRRRACRGDHRDHRVGGTGRRRQLLRTSGPSRSCVRWWRPRARRAWRSSSTCSPAAPTSSRRRSSTPTCSRCPYVGLALDPEWRLAPDQVHLRQIGSVGIDEVNGVVGLARGLHGRSARCRRRCSSCTSSRAG